MSKFSRIGFSFITAVFVAALGAASSAIAAPTYYIDDQGNDSADGTSPGTAWRSLVKIGSNFYPPAGSKILFKRGCSWRVDTSLVLRGSGVAGPPINYGAYGSINDPKPRFYGSKKLDAGWTAVVKPGMGNVWKYNQTFSNVQTSGTETFVPDVGNVYFFSGQSDGSLDGYGWRRHIPGAVVQDKDFYCEGGQAEPKTLYLKLDVNPASRWPRIEAAMNTIQMFVIYGQTGTVVEDLEFRYGGAYAVSTRYSNDVTIRRLNISWMGGGMVLGHEYVRYGNAVDVWAGVSNILIDGNTIDQMYDCGLDIESTGSSPYALSNVAFRNNVISNSGLACFDFFGRSTSGSISGVYFENNACLNSGGPLSWGYAQRDQPGTAKVGADIAFYYTVTPVTGFYIRNNLFYKPQIVFASENSYTSYTTPRVNDALLLALTMDNNSWHPPAGNMADTAIILARSNTPYDPSIVYTYNQRPDWTASSPYGNGQKDAYTLVANPGFASVAITSPASGATVSGNVTITATVAGGANIVGVQFKLNGADLGLEDVTPPYQLTGGTTQLANDASYVLTAVGRDQSGNKHLSEPVIITVKN
jgi:hypothetical protein